MCGGGATALLGMVGVPSGVPGAEAAELPDAVVAVGEADLAIIFWRTSRILSCRHTLFGKASECFSWNADVACARPSGPPVSFLFLIT